MESVKEYIDFMFKKLNELSIEDISYSDYDQMTDWLGEIRKQVKRLEKKQVPMKPVKEIFGNYDCPVCNAYVEFSGNQSYYKHEYCSSCGQAIDWEE